MKILFDFQDTIGGAPRSHLEHAKVLSEKGHEIIAVIDGEENISFFENTIFEVYILPTFGGKSIYERIRIIHKYKNFIEKIEPDLLYTNRTSHNYFLSVVSDLTGIPILCARAGNVNAPLINKANRDRNYVMYSEESYEEFMAMGFKEENLFLIRNRIPKLNLENIQKNFIQNNCTEILVVGNIKMETVNGLKSFLNSFLNNYDKIKKHFKVRIAGQFVKLDQGEINSFKSLIDKCNRMFNPIGEFILLGWVDNLIKYISISDICIGKGRSVIQPLMSGKECYVLSEENGVLYICNESYSDLIKTNFSGRYYKKNNNFETLISNINLGIKGINQELNQKIMIDYSKDFLGDKIEKVIHVTKNKKSKISNSMAVYRFMLILAYGLKNKYIKVKG